jgi:hypothetical protein
MATRAKQLLVTEIVCTSESQWRDMVDMKTAQKLSAIVAFAALSLKQDLQIGAACIAFSGCGLLHI